MRQLKRYLLAQNEEELVSLPQSELISKLDLVYQMTTAEYRIILHSLRKHSDLRDFIITTI